MAYFADAVFWGIQMVMSVRLIVALLAAAHAAVDQAGDCAVLGIHSDTPDDFAILLLDSMASGGPARALTFQ